MKKICSLLILLLLFGCYRSDLDFSNYDYEDEEPKFMGFISKESIRPQAYRRELHDGVPYKKISQYHDYENRNQDYSLGFEHGCQSHNSAIGRSLARVRGYEMDAYKLSYNEKYIRGFRDAEAFCLHKIDWEHH